MPPAAADLLVIGLIGFCAFQGLTNGLFAAAMQTTQFMVPLALALAMFDRISQFITKFGCPEEWAVFGSFAAVFGLGIFGLRKAAEKWAPEEGIDTYKVLDKIGGIAIGAVGGAALVGGILIAWSMCPLTKQLRIDANALKADMGSQVLIRFEKLTQTAGSPNYVFALHGERLARRNSKRAQPMAEPYVDVNQNGKRDPTEPFLDMNEDGQFTKQIMYIDANGNGQWDGGKLDRYIIGHWTSTPTGAQAAAVLPTSTTDAKTKSEGEEAQP